MRRISRFQAIVGERCPRCRQGRMFRYSLLNIPRFARMNDNCPVCGLRFEREPGFFIGSMYISYAISVAIFAVSGFIIYQITNDPPFWSYALGIPGIIVLLLPFIFRYSRVIFLHLFGGVKYEPDRVN